jgi:hypothetical protein
LYNTEINFRRPVNNRVTWLAGFRWVETFDHWRLNGTLPAAGVNAALNLTTANHLYGAQTGLDLRLWDRGGPFRFEGLFKAGIFGNAANQRTTDQSTIGSTTVFSAAVGANRPQVAFVGDIALTGVYQITNALSFRGGYQLLWINGLALATDQVPALSLPNSTGLRSVGGVFYHGAFVGGELRF